jgi:hypothetical protein
MPQPKAKLIINPSLSQSLLERDLGHLRIVAELWGVELNAQEPRLALQSLEVSLLDQSRIQQTASALPEQARTALDDLVRQQGRIPWSLFTRRYGEVRVMGAGRRDRERPHLTPISPAEILWYRALVARAFFDTPKGLVEFAYIPDNLLPRLPPPQSRSSNALGCLANSAERARPRLANDHLVDHACTLLAGLRLGLAQEELGQLAASWESGPNPLTLPALTSLLSSVGLLDMDGLPQPEAARLFLEAERGQALAQLARAWLSSVTFNDLRLISHLSFEGNWNNDPLQARRAVLNFLSSVPTGAWWSLPAFVAGIREHYPDYQRPAGDYDAWFIRDKRSGEYARGFEHWYTVDGELVRFMVTGPLHWLGILDLALPESHESSTDTSTAVTAFRKSGWASALLEGEAPDGLPLEEAKLLVGSDGRLRAPRLVPRAARYQVARFCAWEGEKDDEYRYRITPLSLGRARQQGLTTLQLLNLIRRSAQALPPSLVKAIERWEQHGAEARMEQLTVLRLATPDLMQAVRSSRASRYLGDLLGPTAVIIKTGATEKVLTILAELGYLGEITF